MICPQCHAENGPGDKFCLQCGAPLYASATPDATFAGSAPEDLVLVPKSGGEPIPLGSRTVIGRMNTCDIPVQDKSVSREHARLSQLPGGYMLEDLGSTNGTLVNGQRITEATIIRPGDALTFGTVEFELESKVPEPQAAMAERPTLDFPPLQPISPAASEPNNWQPSGAAGSPFASPIPSGEDGPSEEPVTRSAAYESGEMAAISAPVPPMQPEEATMPEPPAPAVQEPAPTTEDQTAQLADDVVATSARLNDLIQQLADQLSRPRPRAETSNPVREIVAGVPASPMTPEQLAQARQVLDGLAADPRDIELLMQVGQLAPSLSRLLQQYGQLENVLNAVIEATGAAAETAPA